MKKEFKITRTWYVEAEDVQDTIDKSKNWDHDEVTVAVKAVEHGERYCEERYLVVHDENMYDTDDAVSDTLSEKNLSRKFSNKKVKKYRFGVERVAPTDCSLFITDGKIHKVFGIDGESWKMVSSLMILGSLIPDQYNEIHCACKSAVEISDNHDAASIARHLLYSNTSEDEI